MRRSSDWAVRLSIPCASPMLSLSRLITSLSSRRFGRFRGQRNAQNRWDGPTVRPRDRKVRSGYIISVHFSADFLASRYCWVINQVDQFGELAGLVVSQLLRFDVVRQ